MHIWPRNRETERSSTSHKIGVADFCLLLKLAAGSDDEGWCNGWGSCNRLNDQEGCSFEWELCQLFSDRKSVV